MEDLLSSRGQHLHVPAARAASELAPMPLKRCGACSRDKSVSEFNFKVKAKGILQAKCRLCSREASAEHYRANVDTYLAKASRNNDIYRERNRALQARSLKGQRCCLCPSKIDLTHWAGGMTGTQPVSEAVTKGLSEEAVLNAIACSIIVCRPCLQSQFAAALARYRDLPPEAKRAHVAPNPAVYKKYRGVGFNAARSSSDSRATKA